MAEACRVVASARFTATTSSGGTAVALPTSGIPTGVTRQVRVYNSGANTVTVRFGSASVSAATPTSTFIVDEVVDVGAGFAEVFTIGAADTHFALVADSGSNVVSISLVHGA